MASPDSIHTLADIEAIEREMPWERRVAESSAYERVANVARRLPQKPAVLFLANGLPDDVPIAISYGDLLRRMTQTANLLHDFDVGPGDAVSLLLPNLPHMHYLLWGASAAGIVNPINPLLRAPQVAEILQAAGSRLLVTTGPGTDLWVKAQAAIRMLPYPVDVLRVGGEETAEALDFDKLAAGYPDDRLSSDRIIQRDDIAAYFHTGGTTGDPKLAQHTHDNQIFQGWVCGALGLSETDVVPVALPMFHVAAAYCWGLGPLWAGATIVLLGPMGYRGAGVVQNLWKVVERYGATRVGVVPTIASALLNVPKEGIDIGSLQRIGCGAAPLSPEVFRALENYAGVPVLEGYGLTEGTALTHCNPREGERRIGSIGLRCPYVETRVVRGDAQSHTDVECAPNEVGALRIKGPTVISGYRQERHNRGAFVDDGWFDTGDLGYVDQDGYFWITGRAKDLIIRGGHNISPAWIEEALYQHPAVAFAAAVGKPDSYAGEIPIAYVVLKPGSEVTVEQLRVFATERVPERPAAPAEVIVIPEMPTTAVGKIFKPGLRQDAARRALEGALASLRETDLEVVVEVASHERFGSCARVTVKGCDPGDHDHVRTRIDGILGPFTIRREIVII